MNAAPALSPAPDIRVLIVDDSAIVRGLEQRWIEAEQGVVVAGVAVNGLEGVRLARTLAPDVIVLDVEMPQLDGLAAIPQIIEAAPHAKILMASTLTRRNAEVTLRALSLGATDYIAKPETGRLSAADDFRRDLIARIRALAPRRPHAAIPRPAAPVRTLAQLPRRAPEIIAIGASTGGPQALRTLIAGIGGRARQPILIVQHMPAMFTAILAEHLAKASPAPAMEARDGLPLKPGAIYLAPGDFHMRIVRKHGAPVIALDQSPPINFCRPAVDPLFKSAAEVYGDGVLALVLTGMGADGRNGAEAIVKAGGAVLVQDEASSVVWGMPGAVAQAGLAAAIAPLNDLPRAVLSHAMGRATGSHA